MKKKKNAGGAVESSKITYYLLCVPAVLLSGFVILIPGIQTVYSAFTSWNGISSVKEWVGLENFRSLASDYIFKRAVVNNIKWTLIFLTIPVVMSLLASLLMVYFKVGKKTFQTIYLIPYLLAPTTNAIIWLNMIFSPNAGLVGFLQKMGVSITSPLGNMSTALFGVAMVDIWHYWGFLTVIFLAAFRQTPTEELESAKLDGANMWQTFRYIYFPNIAPTVRLMLVLIVIYSFCTYDYIYLLTGGGPAHATEVLSTYAYTTAFSAFKFGRASAIALAIGLIGSVVAFFYTWFSRKEAMD